jgi:hypothetical protein
LKARIVSQPPSDATFSAAFANQYPRANSPAAPSRASEAKSLSTG